MIKLKIKLDNGVEIKKILDDKQIQQAESNKYFKKIEKQNNNDFKKYQKETYHYGFIKDDKKLKQRAEDLQLYVGFLQTL